MDISLFRQLIIKLQIKIHIESFFFCITINCFTARLNIVAWDYIFIQTCIMLAFRKDIPGFGKEIP